MTIEALPFEHRPRNSIANNLDKINELVDWVNLDTHLYASTTGERVTVEDASSLKGLMVDGRSVQDGTPTPDAPVDVQVVEGRNLLPSDTTSKTISGVTFTLNADGSVTANGTAASGVAVLDYLPMSGQNITLQAGTYTLSGCPSGGGSSTYKLDINDKNDTYRTDYGSGATFTLNSSLVFRRCRIVIYSDVTVNNLVFRPQLEAGSTATPYVPYGSIGILIGDTATPIDLQGNTLASLPDGTRDELHVDSAGHVWIESISWRGTIASVGTVNTSGSTYYATITPTDASGKRNWSSAEEFGSQPGTPRAWCSKCTSDGTGIYVARTWNDAYAYAPASLGLTQEDFDKLVGAEFVTKNKTATIDLGYIDPPAIPSGSVVTISASLTPTFHLEWWVDDGITALVDDLIAYIDYKTEE